MAISLIKNPDERNDPPRPLMEHLMALRDMIVFMALSWVTCAIVAGCCTPLIMKWLTSPAGADQQYITGLDLTSGINSIVSIAGWGGTALSFPFLLYAVLRFVFPALTNREKFVIMSILLVGTGFFLAGGAVAYSQTLPMIVQAFQTVNRWVGFEQMTILRVENYISIVLKTLIAFGLVLQVPLILFVLGWFGVVTSKGLREKRRLAIVLIFFIAMVLTPPDPMSQIFMAVPLCLLYELAIWAVWLKERGSFKGRK